MASICLYLHMHQPYRIKRYRIFDVGYDHHYFNEEGENERNNKAILQKVAYKSYIPTAKTLLELLRVHPEFKVSFSITGTVLEQFVASCPEMIDLIREIIATGRAEILGETYHHSLAFFYSRPEFERQVALHADTIHEFFGVRPRVFRNTELSYTNALGTWADEQGYAGIITEGWEPVLGWRSPNFVYRPVGATQTKLLLKNYKLSDDVAFRFSNRGWKEWPLSAEKYAQWVSAVNGSGEVVNLFMDYETFGEHQWEDTGIFAFLRHMPGEILQHPDNTFMTPTEVATTYEARDEVDVPHILTWADTERDLSAWSENDMQQEALRACYELEDEVLGCGDAQLLEDWRRLQISDHFYYMCTKWFSDGDVHAYFSPYQSPYEAFIAYMNAMKDMRGRIEKLARKGVGVRG